MGKFFGRAAILGPPGRQLLTPPRFRPAQTASVLTECGEASKATPTTTSQRVL
jgi:hypothetical protein